MRASPVVSGVGRGRLVACFSRGQIQKRPYEGRIGTPRAAKLSRVQEIRPSSSVGAVAAVAVRRAFTASRTASNFRQRCRYFDELSRSMSSPAFVRVWRSRTTVDKRSAGAQPADPSVGARVDAVPYRRYPCEVLLQ